jgi:TPP-dependent pyruvate/acetoin dehydrogenase alpha subunit
LTSIPLKPADSRVDGGGELALDPEMAYRALYRIRRVEEAVASVYPTDKIKSPVHLSIGQEAIAVGVAAALTDRDVVFGTYRGHAIYLAKGGDLKRMLAELYGKATGSAKGKGGSMHLVDVEHGVMGMSAVVATTIPHAAGYAYAQQLRGADRVVAAFFGDGGTEEGVYYETLNFAALHSLPMLFVCENNGYAIHTPVTARQKPGTGIARRAEAFGMPAVALTDDDVFSIARAAQEAVSAIRRGEGPQFLECPTYRWMEHVGPGEDEHIGYRSVEHARPWKENDQVLLVGRRLDLAHRQQIEAEVEEEIREAFAFAESSPFPAESELLEDAYAA